MVAPILRDDEVDRLVGRFADDHGVAGLAAGIVRDGRLVHAVTIGHSSIAGNRPVTARSVFRAGSISKILTAIAVMQLVADGRVDLDGPVNDHLSEFSINTPVGSRPVTVRDLLTHTSGIGELRRWSDIARPSIGMAVAPDRPMPSLGDYYAPALQAGVPAGQKWSYANHGFAVLGAVVEHVTGKSFAQYVRDAILDPLAMTGSDFSRSDRVSAELCDGYAIGRRGNKAVRYMDIIPGPAGALFTNLDDMARFIGVLCDEGGNILDAASLGMMISPQFHVDTRLPAMGLAFFLSNLAGHRVVSHDGGVDGFISHLRVAPDDGAGVIVFTNSASTEISMAIDRLGDELLQVVLLGGVLPRSSVPVHTEGQGSLLGAYGLRRGFNTNARLWMHLGGEVVIEADADHLTFRSFTGPARAPRPLVPIDPHDPTMFATDIGPMTLQVAFTAGAMHLGPPLNATMVRRAPSFRRRLRGAAAVVAAGAAALIVARRVPS